MKYKVGDKVRIKSIDWYNENKDLNGNINCGSADFLPDMVIYCGDILTVCDINERLSYYNVKESSYVFKDEMIECLVERNGKTYPYKIGDRVVLKGNNRCATITDLKYNSWGNLSYYIKIDNDKDISIDYPANLLLPYDHMVEGLVEEETKYGTASYSVKPKSNANCLTRERVDELATKIDKELPSGNQNVWELPDDYQFVDENGNVINATKIVLEKKKKEYPKTYEECCKVMNYCCNPVSTKTTHKEELIRKFQFLLLYRDAYWKIAGDEMGLGKPWEPDWKDGDTHKFNIHVIKDEIRCGVGLVKSDLLSFPTEEMRDAFKENFDPDIEICKELL